MGRDHFPLGRSGETPWEGVKSVLRRKELAGLERWRAGSQRLCGRMHKTQESDHGAWSARKPPNGQSSTGDTR